MEYESKDCDEQKPGAERAGNTSHDGQDSVLEMLCLALLVGTIESRELSTMFKMRWNLTMPRIALVQRDLPGKIHEALRPTR